MAPVKPTHITWHWSAMPGEETFVDYHLNVEAYGSVVLTRSLFQLGRHTWHRNTANAGIAFDNTGPAAIDNDDRQLEVVCKLTAEVCHRFGINPRGTVMLDVLRRVGTPDGPDDALVPTGEKRAFPTVSDHAIFAKADGYYPERWDIGSQESDPAKNVYKRAHAKMLWYFDKLADHSIPFEYGSHIA